MPNYENGKIYSLRSHQTDDIYIGSTTQSLAVRKAGHKINYKRYVNGTYNFVTSFNIIKFDDFYIELIENYPCNSRNELERREGQLIREMDCVNKIVVGRTDKEYYEANKEVIAERAKEYREANKEVIAERTKKWREANKEVIAENEKKYREANKEVIAENKKKWQAANEEKLKEKKFCECGGKYTHVNKAQHSKSKKHQAYMNANV